MKRKKNNNNQYNIDSYLNGTNNSNISEKSMQIKNSQFKVYDPSYTLSQIKST